MSHTLTTDPRGAVTTSGGQCGRAAALEQRLACLADAGPAAIDARIAELDRECSAGRMAKAALGVMIVVGSVLAAVHSSWWLVLPGVAAVFLIQYMFGRHSWMTAAFANLGYRTGTEIEHEKFALKTLRGDFKHVPTVHDIEAQDDITRLEGEGGIVVEPDASKVDAKVAVREVIEATKSG
jgi:hypothetical protein